MLISRLTTAALLVLCMAGSAAAQAVDEFDASRPVPGWVMTPGVAIGATFDDNPVLAGHGNENPNDTITAVAPSLELTFRGKHTVFGAAYNGSLVRYRTLDEFNSFDQGARVELRQQASKRVGLHFRNYFSASPTTDVVQVAGLPFIRTGTRQNEFIGGTTIQATRRLELNGSYRFQWLEFERPESFTTPLLDGGKTHAFTVGALQAIATHLKVGGSYTYQHSIVGEVGEVFDIQNGEGTVAMQLAPTVTLDAGAGFSHLSLPAGLGSRTGPAGRISLQKRTPHALYVVSAMRSFVPAFGFGGSLQNSEVSGGVRVPFAATRGFVQANLAWRDSEPVLENEVGLSTVWLETTLGYGLQRWLRLEVFYSGAFQDTTVEGGRIDRNRVGVQLVTLRPMRIQ
jgi:hypothetical protein